MDLLIPWRDSGDSYRRAAFDFLCKQYGETFTIVTGDSDPEKPFNRSAARNDAAARSDSEVLAFVDADAWMSPDQIKEAMELAFETRRLVRPFHRAGFLTEESTSTFLDTGVLTAEYLNPPAEGFIGLAWVIRRDLFARLGGFDPKFEKYGGEDNAFSASCDVLYGGIESVPGEAYSLWHPADRHTPPENIERLTAYYHVKTWDDYSTLRAM